MNEKLYKSVKSLFLGDDRQTEESVGGGRDLSNSEHEVDSDVIGE